MNLIDVVSKFQSEADCLNYVEAVRWPSGVCCLKCGVTERISKFTTNETTRVRRNRRGEERIVRVPARRLYECKDCGYQFSATTGTVFHDSHLSLIKWFMAVGLIVEAKKGISAKQVAQHLGLEKSYKTAWYLCHRIRKAMKEGGLLTGVVEVDETYLTPKKPRKGKPRVKKTSTDVVLGMVERGGNLRLIPVKDAKLSIIEPEPMKHISEDATLQTDEAAVYHIIGKRRFNRTPSHDQPQKFLRDWRHSHQHIRECIFAVETRHLRHVPQSLDKAPAPLLQRVFVPIQSAQNATGDV